MIKEGYHGYSYKKHSMGKATPKELRRLAKIPVVTQGASVFNSNFSFHESENKGK